MSIEITSIGSSSSGNSYIIRAGGHVILLDVGLTAKRICEALSELDISPEDVDAVLITHEHVDHVRSVRAIARKCGSALVYASRGTFENTENFCHVPEERLRLVGAGEIAEIGDLQISTFPLSHDAAEPIGYAIEVGGEKLAVVTDTGIITDEIYEAIHDAGILVFEANHDLDMLMFGGYPYRVKVRIKSDNGHLSNDYAGEVLARILEDRREQREKHPDGVFAEPLRIMLAHLSFHNNMPLFARQTVEDALTAAGFRKGSDYLIEVAAREGLTSMPLIQDSGEL